MLVVDLDVHQGDGTHAALAGDDDAFTFSLNGLGNYPFRRVPAISSAICPRARVTTPTWTRSPSFCPSRSSVLAPSSASTWRAPIPFEGDRLGRLALTHAGLASRDQLVRSSLLRAGIPVCVTLAGGYAERIEDTVAINLATLRAFA